LLPAHGARDEFCGRRRSDRAIDRDAKSIQRRRGRDAAAPVTRATSRAGARAGEFLFLDNGDARRKKR